MTISRNLANKMMVELKEVTVVLWDIAYLSKKGTKEEKEESKQRLSILENDLNKHKNEEGDIVEGLKIYYNLNRSETRLSRFLDYINKIKEKKFNEVISEMESFNNALNKKIGEYMYLN